MGDCIQVGFYFEEEGLCVYSKLCHRFDTKNRQKQTKVWNKEACIIYHTQGKAKHEASVTHREALENEHACHVVKVQGGNAGAGGTLYFIEILLIDAMKCLYWLRKQKISHSCSLSSCK